VSDVFTGEEVVDSEKKTAIIAEAVVSVSETRMADAQS